MEAMAKARKNKIPATITLPLSPPASLTRKKISGGGVSKKELLACPQQ